MIINSHYYITNDIDRSLNETVTDKNRKYRVDYNINLPNTISFMTVIPSTSGRLHSDFVCLLFLQSHRETDRFFTDSGVQLPQHDRVQFHFLHTAVSSQLKSKIGNILDESEDLRIMLNIDGSPVTSRSQTHPSHSQTSRFLTSSLSLGVPGPHVTQCM